MTQSARPFDEIDTDLLITLLPIRPYEKVAMAGCSNTQLCTALAKYLSQGRLYALDSNNKTLDICREKLSNVPLTNFTDSNYEQASDYIENQAIDGILIDHNHVPQGDISQILAFIKTFLSSVGWISLIEQLPSNSATSSTNQITEPLNNQLAGIFRLTSSRSLNKDTLLHHFRK